MKISALLTRSLVEINAADAGSTVQPEVFSLALDTCNMILDYLNAKDRALIADLFSTFTITANLNPHTIGPTGATWTYAISRPTDVLDASIILNSGSTPYPYVPLRKLNAQEWAKKITPTLASTLANEFYYDPTYPNGSFYFWTVEQTAYQAYLHTRQQLAQVTAATDFELPQGYWYLLMLLVAKACAGPLRKVWKPEQEQTLIRVQGDVWGINAPDLTLATIDAGMPTTGVSGRRQDFNYLTGQIV